MNETQQSTESRTRLPAAAREVLDRSCTCGHRLGEHRSGNPDDCMAAAPHTPGGGKRRTCACETFEFAGSPDDVGAAERHRIAEGLHALPAITPTGVERYVRLVDALALCSTTTGGRPLPPEFVHSVSAASEGDPA